MQWKGWQFEKTLLISSNSKMERKNEIIVFNIHILKDRAKNSPRDLRVVLKSDYDKNEKELEFQVLRHQVMSDFLMIEIAAKVDFKSLETVRIGVLYGNPKAEAKCFDSELLIDELADGQDFSNRFFQATFDKCGLIKKLQRVFMKGSFFAQYSFSGAKGLLQQGPTIVFANQKNKSLQFQEVAFNAENPLIQSRLDAGNLITIKTLNGTLQSPYHKNQKVLCQKEIHFLNSKNYFIETTTLEFESETFVGRILIDSLDMASAQVSHFSFRPSTPTFNTTEVEELGHILLDEEFTKSLPEGNMFGGFMPIHLPWVTFFNDLPEKRFALSSILLNFQNSSDANYRNGNYLFKNKNSFSLVVAPLFIEQLKSVKEFLVVPAKTKIQLKRALHFSDFAVDGWAQEVDNFGKLINTPFSIEEHPKPIELSSAQQNDFLLFGKHSKDYLTTGVR